MIIMKLNFNRDGSGSFPEYLKKRYENELSCYQILKFEMGKLVSESSKSYVFVVGFSLRHRETGQLACFIFSPADMAYDIREGDFPRFTFAEGTKLRVSGTFIFGELSFCEEFCSFDVCVPRFWYCHCLNELKALMELYALWSEDKLLIDAVSTAELPKPVIWNSFVTYAYFLNDEKALIIKDLEISEVNDFLLSLENRDTDSCFCVVDKQNLTFPEKKLYQQSDGKYFYFDGDVFYSRRGKYVTEKEAKSYYGAIKKRHPQAIFWPHPIPYSYVWLVGVVSTDRENIYLGIDVLSGKTEVLDETLDVSFPALPNNSHFIFDDNA